MTGETRLYTRIILVVLIFIGTVWVLAPFLAATLFAIILCLSSWPVFKWIEDRLWQRSNLAATVMTLLLILAILLPMAYFAMALAGHVPSLIANIRDWLVSTNGKPPSWLVSLPFVGEPVAAYWLKLAANQEELAKLGNYLFEPTRILLTKTVSVMIQGLLQLILVILIAFFFYRDGDYLSCRLAVLAHKIGGQLGSDMLALTQKTIMGVMIGLVGTAAAQSLVALIGFVIAGVPSAVLLAGATFFLSMIPMGPPLIWGGTAWWLYDQGYVGWSIFMVIWGTGVISGIDNFIRPVLISQTTNLPVLLIMLGVLGGVLAFGFVGIFIGPVVLTLGLTLVDRWSVSVVEPVEP